MNHLRTETIARLAAAHVENVAAATFRRDLKSDATVERNAADWANARTMLAQPGRPLDAAAVLRFTRMGKRAGATAAEIASVLATATVSA